MSPSTSPSSTTATRTSTKPPTPAQKRILTELASRPAAKIINGPYGCLLTDGRGWSPAQPRVTQSQLVALVRAGWVMYTRAPMGRAEYVATAAGREAVRP